MSHAGPSTAAPPPADAGIKGMIGGGIVLLVIFFAIVFAYATRTPPPAAAAAATATSTPPPIVVQKAVPQKMAMEPTFYPFGADGCYEKDLGYEARWSPKDKAMRVHNPAGGSHVEALGQKPTPLSAFGPGTWRFCKEDPDA